MAALEGLSERDKAVLRSIFDPNVTIGDVTDEEDQFQEDDHQESLTDAHRESIQLCIQGVQLAEKGKLEDALTMLNKGVEAAPDRPAGYNDRAQLLRLMERDDAAMADLDKVLDLTSGGRSRARALALCQRGVLLRKRRANDEARVAFREAAQLGSSFAKKQVVDLNPYAALCNQMLSQVMRGETDIKL